MLNSRITAKPFVKWAGGKGQLLDQIEFRLPSQLYNKEFTYIEPFVGGGALLFFLLQNFSNIKRVIINDINRHLTDAYRTIKSHPLELIERLKIIEQEHLLLSTDERKNHYLRIRNRYNHDDSLTTIDKTALLIFLNRTCFNGLYRENSKGEFNVPFGRYSNPNICNESLIKADSELLNRFDVQILTGDYQQTLTAINSRGVHFIYFDPPYRPLSSTSNFNSYVKETFNDNSQRELANFCRKISQQKNVLWMLSNSDCSAKNPNDTFFEDLYKGFNIQRVFATRMVNSNASKRGKLTELLIRNYENTKTNLSIDHQLKLAL